MVQRKGATWLSRERCKTIYDMSCLGIKNVDIAKYYKLHQSTISKVIQCYKSPLTVQKKRSGRKRKLSDQGMRMFQKYVLRNRFEPLHVILARFKTHTGFQLSECTGRRYMRILKLESFIAIQKPFLTRKNIASRIFWARTHQHWTQSQWSRVLFTDESSFTVRP